VPLCPPQNQHAARTRTQAAAVGSQRLTAELRHGRKNDLLSYKQEVSQNNSEFFILTVQKLLENYLEFVPSVGKESDRFLAE
jgi:hypothetical protein